MSTPKLPNGQLPANAIVLQPGMSLDAVERLVILSTMEACEGNKTQAAKVLGVDRRTLRAKLKKIGRDEDFKDLIARDEIAA